MCNSKIQTEHSDANDLIWSAEIKSYDFIFSSLLFLFSLSKIRLEKNVKRQTESFDIIINAMQ